MSTIFAQMTNKERAEHIGCWVNTPLGHGVLLGQSINGHYKPLVVIPSRGEVYNGRWDWKEIDLLPETPRAWGADGTIPTNIVTMAKCRKLPSLVYGETIPYAWAIYQGKVPIKRFIRATQAWDYFFNMTEKIVEKQQLN